MYKVIIGKLNGWSLIIDDELLEKYNTIWNKVNADIKKNLIASLSTVKNFWKAK